MECDAFNCHEPATHALLVVPGQLVRHLNPTHTLWAFLRCRECGRRDVKFNTPALADRGAKCCLVPLPERVLKDLAEVAV